MKIAQKLVRLVYNPTAGEGEHSKNSIISLLKAHGYACDYSSSKKKLLKAIDPNTDLIAIAGGDGTIRKTIIHLLDKKLKFKRPLAILPYGTANNIATSLKIETDPARNIASWADCQLRPFDVGQVTSTGKPGYFLESFGFGIFPRLMEELKQMDTSANQSPEEEFDMALDQLLNLVMNYKSRKCRLEIAGKIMEEDCIMVEVMNISSMGPKLRLNAGSDPGDGLFEVIMVGEKDRENLAAYIKKKKQDKDKNPVFPIKAVQTRHLSFFCEGKDFHMDDEILDAPEPREFKITVLDSLLQVISSK